MFVTKGSIRFKVVTDVKEDIYIYIFCFYGWEIFLIPMVNILVVK